MEIALTAKILADVGNNFFHFCWTAPNFGGFIPFCKAEFAVVIASFGDVPVDDDTLFEIHGVPLSCLLLFEG
jgi:hypothetical protein